MKSISAPLFVLLGLVTLGPLNLQAQELKVGVVDYGRIQRHYYRTDLERKALEEKREKEQERVAQELEGTKDLMEAQQAAQLELQDPTLSDEKKQAILKDAQKRAAEINEMQRKALELQKVANTELAQTASQAHINLNKEIYEAITKVAQTIGLDMVQNRTFGLNGVPTLPYTNTERLQDITDQVIGELNKNAPAGWSTPAGE